MKNENFFELCENCDNAIHPNEVEYWHDGIVCSDCLDLLYAEAKEGIL